MNKIDTSRWKTFKIGDLFSVSRPISRKQNDYEDGETPFVASGCFNNGVQAMLEPKDADDIDEGQCITISPVDGYAFYQEEDFLGRGGAGSSIIILRNKNLNRYNGQFIASVIRHIFKSWTYSDMGTADIVSDSYILLPATADDIPDFAYMESYMQNLECAVRASLAAARYARSAKFLSENIGEWEIFRLDSLFTAKNTGNILARDVADGSGTTPYVTASGINNGLVAYINADNYEIIKGNCILVGGKTFTLTYQKEDFVSNDSHNFALYLNNVFGNKSITVYFFLVSVLKVAFSHKYTWGDAVTKDKLLDETILLPADLDGNPDWLYMENYMKNLSAKAKSVVCGFSALCHA